jgi:sugar lactone lactonase YvrE
LVQNPATDALAIAPAVATPVIMGQSDPVLLSVMPVVVRRFIRALGVISMTIARRLVLAVLLIAGSLRMLPAEAQTIVPVAAGFNHPQGVAVDPNGNLFVADTANVAVTELLSAGGHGAANTLQQGFNQPLGVAFDAAGNLFVADSANNTVREVLAAGGYVTVNTIGSGFNFPESVAVDGSGNVFVADTGSNAVKEILAAGGYTAINTLGSGFNSPRGVAVDGSGNVFVADWGNNAVKEILASGGYVTVQTLGPGFAFPNNVAVDAGGNVFVTFIGGVAEALAAGGYTTVKAVGSDFIDPWGIALDGSGNVFVADWGGDTVYEIPAAGGYTTVSDLDGKFDKPGGIALDAGGNVFVADSYRNVVAEMLAAGGYATVVTVGSGITAPTGIAVDGSGNVFIANQISTYVAESASPVTTSVKEILASGGYVAVKTLGSDFGNPRGVAIDGSGNVFVADTANQAVYEILADSGYVTVKSLGSGFSNPTGVAVDGSGNVFVANAEAFIEPGIGTPGAVYEILADGGYTTVKTLGGGFIDPTGVAVDVSGNVVVADPGNHAIYEALASGGFATVKTLGSGFGDPVGVAVDASDNVFVIDGTTGAVQEILASPSTTLASVLPGSRSVQLGTPATIFATMINTAPAALDNCTIALPPSAPTGLTLDYQTTDPTTNKRTGTPNTPAIIPGNGGLQTFVVAFQGTQAFTASALPVAFACAGAAPAANLPGVDTVDLTLSTTPVADIITAIQTPTGDGIMVLPPGGGGILGSGAFAVASTNLGVTTPITVSFDTGTSFLPLQGGICQTDPGTGQCLAPPDSSVTPNYAGGAIETFSVFLQTLGPITFEPAWSRIFVRFTDADGGNHGSISVAVRTN